MSNIDEIMGAIGRHGDDCIRDADAASESFDTLREMIAAALADAERKGAEAMKVAPSRDCVSHMMVVAGRAQEAETRKNGFSGKSIRRAICNAIAQDKNLRKKLCSGEPKRALPLPTGPRQAVQLTDEQIARAYCEALGVEYLPPTDEDADQEAYSALMRVGSAIQALVLAANGLEVRRG